MIRKLYIIFTLNIVFLLGFTVNIQANELSEREIKTIVTRMLRANPEILFEIFTENAEEFIEVITEASEIVRANKLMQNWEHDLKNPKQFEENKRPMLGNPNAKNIIVGFSDFLCAYCGQAAKTVEDLVKNRNDIKFIFKASPSNEASAIASTWFYYIYQKDSQKAWEFHNRLFANQEALAKNTDAFLMSLATSLGFDAKKLALEIKNNEKMVQGLIQNDVQEAKKYGFTGTPYFVINNIVLRGAYPRAVFEKALDFSNKK